MNTRSFLIAYGAGALVFLAIDAVWLSTMADRLYRPSLAHLLSQQPDLRAAGLFYALYLLGMVTLAVAPALASGQWSDAATRGALLGLVAYATYDLTNQATLQGWPWHITLIDLLWGTLLTAVASGAAAWAALRWR